MQHARSTRFPLQLPAREIRSREDEGGPTARMGLTTCSSMRDSVSCPVSVRTLDFFGES